MEQNRGDSSNPNNKNPNPGQKPRGFTLTKLVLALVIVLAISWIYSAISDGQYEEKIYSDFLSAMNQKQLAEVRLEPDRIIYLTKEEAAKPGNEQKACFTGLPRNGDMVQLANELTHAGVKVNQIIVEDNSTIMMILSYAIMIGGMFLVMNMITNKACIGMMLGIGITFQFGIQAILNICVVTNSLPNTGISLPFFSYGGTSLCMLLAEMGLILSISRSSKMEKS